MRITLFAIKTIDNQFIKIGLTRAPEMILQNTQQEFNASRLLASEPRKLILHGSVVFMGWNEAKTAKGQLLAEISGYEINGSGWFDFAQGEVRSAIDARIALGRVYGRCRAKQQARLALEAAQNEQFYQDGATSFSNGLPITAVTQRYKQYDGQWCLDGINPRKGTRSRFYDNWTQGWNFGESTQGEPF